MSAHAAEAALDSLLKRDRWIVAAALAGIAAIAWAHLIYEAHALSATGICRCLGMQMSGPDTKPWSAATLLPLFLMWAEMMIAMMLPAAAPMILLFSALSRKRQEAARPFVPTAYFVGGYLAIWTAFSAGAALLQWLLHGTALLSPGMAASSRWLGSVVLVTAGVFQWTPLKRACLNHCRSPLGFLMTGWRDGRGGAFAMGLSHGSYCAGCCWMLMLLLFVAGVMNVVWIAALSIFVLAEKAAPQSLRIERVAGALLLVWAALVAWP